MSRWPKDLDAFERKVKPIYDALDSRNWKGALKVCQQALQKYPDNELVKVLKAIGLERSGKREEANQVVDEVLALSPPSTDEQVLRLSAMVLRASGRLPDITRMYERAAEAAAAAAAAGGGRGGGAAAAELALALQHEVFGAHVREFNYVKQQQVALKLSKAVGTAPAPPSGGGVSGERYGWWVVMSLLLQARAALRAAASGLPAPAGQVPAVALGPDKLMALAEGMVARQASRDGRLEGYEALMVYVDLLIAQGKPSAALELVAGPLGASAIRLPSERLQLRAVLSALSGDLGGAAEALREGLALNPDDWGAILLLLDCLLPGSASQEALITTTPAAAAADAAASATNPTAATYFAPRHPLVCISGGLAEQMPPRGVPLPPEGGCSPEAFDRAEAMIREAVELAGRTSSPPSEEGGNGGGGGGSSKSMIMRGPDLALVDLACRRHRAASTYPACSGGGGADTTEGAVVDAVLSYYRKYGHLVSCAVDLRPYVSRLGPSEATARLAREIQELADEAAAAVTSETAGTDSANGASGSSGSGGSGSASGSATTKERLSALRVAVCGAQLRDDLGLPEVGSCGQGVELAGRLMELYGSAQPLQAGLDERERGAADELPVLAAAALATSAGLAPSDAAAVPYLLSAYAAAAHAAASHRPYGAGLRIVASALAGLLAAPAAAAAHLAKLDLKHIQLDSLAAHLLLPNLLAWPHAGAAGSGAGGGAGEAAAAAAGPSLDAAAAAGGSQGQGQLLARALRDSGALFDDHGRDAGETLFTAYGHGMYTKVFEFVAFRERLAASLTLAVVRGEGAMADSLRGGSSSGGGGSSATGEVLVPAADVVRGAAVAAAARLPPDSLPSADRLRYNWDLCVRPTWLPPCAEAGPRGAVAEWWRARGRGEVRGQGYGRAWWSSPCSAEGPSPDGAAGRWRSGQAEAAAHRWLTTHALAGALAATGAAAPGPGVLPLREAVERMRGLLQQSRTAQEDGGDAATPSSSSSSSSGCSTTVPGAVDLRRLDVELYGAALAVQDCLAAVGGTSAAAASPSTAKAPPDDDASDPDASLTAAEAALSSLVAAMRRLADAAAGGVVAAVGSSVDGSAGSGWGGWVLPGGSLAAMSAVLREQMTVAAACVQSWQAALKALRKRRAKTTATAAEGMTELHHHLQRLSDAVAAAAEGLAAAARVCVEALGAASDSPGLRLPPSEAARQLVAHLQSHFPAPSSPSPSSSPPPGWLSSPACASALEGLIREQRATLGALARHAGALQAALS